MQTRTELTYNNFNIQIKEPLVTQNSDKNHPKQKLLKLINNKTFSKKDSSHVLWIYSRNKKTL